MAFLLLFIQSAMADEIKLAVIGAKTGSASVINLNMFKMARILVTDLNQHGGIIGKKIDLIEIDNKSTSLGSKQAAKKAVKYGVTAVIGAMYSSHSLAMGPILQQAGIPMLSPASTTSQLTRIGDYIFRVCYTDSFQGRVMAEFARKQFDAKNVLVITNIESQYSIGLAKVFIKSFTKFGGENIWEEDYMDKITDLNEITKKIEEKNPDLIFLPNHSIESSKIITHIRHSGINTIFLGGDGMNNEMYHFVDKEIDGNYYSNHWHQDVPNMKNRKLIKKYESEFGVISQAIIPLTYDAIMVLIEAIKKTNSLNHSVIRNALAKTTGFEGATGTISFDQNGDPKKQVVIIKLENRKAVYFKTVLPK